MILLETCTLSATAGSGSADQKTLYKNLNLKIHAGENWAILGPNGCGKTTLMHNLAGLTEPESGTINLGNKPIKSWAHKKRAQQIGILFQQEETLFPASVFETVLTGRHPHIMARGLQAVFDWEDNEDFAIAEQALNDVGLLSLKDRSITTLSGGEWRRVMIAALLAQKTSITLYDEISNHLDLNHQQKILKHITKQVTDGNRANLFVLQDINQALRHCEYGLLLFDNGQHMTGPLQEIISESTLAELYHCPFTVLEHTQGNIFLPS
ncbi:MAG: ABC transporter ATP-binding protein [Acidiferrobacterales bacterium]